MASTILKLGNSILNNMCFLPTESLILVKEHTNKQLLQAIKMQGCSVNMYGTTRKQSGLNSLERQIDLGLSWIRVEGWRMLEEG